MKVGIMSMQRIENYGSFLQAYSLKQMLQELGHEVIFIDYVIEPCIAKEQEKAVQYHSIFYRAVRKGFFLIKNIVKALNGQKSYEEKIESMRLRNCYRDYVKELGVSDDRKENVPVDVLVIGSDEVFNCLQTNPVVGYSKQLFGENVKAKKVISYAASAGFTTIKGLESAGIQDEVANMLKKNFSAISVRDQNTFDLVQSLTSKDPEMHLDPVLVADFTPKVLEKHDLKKYVIVYSYEDRMSDRLDEAQAIQEFAHKRGLKTVSIGNFQSWTDLKIEASPFELLGYIKNADYIVTDTFHGTIFSIILKKQFATIIRDSNQQKLKDLLDLFDLDSRRIQAMSDLEKILTTPAAFDKIDKIRMTERQRALQYLKKSIGSQK